MEYLTSWPAICVKLGNVLGSIVEKAPKGNLKQIEKLLSGAGC